MQGRFDEAIAECKIAENLAGRIPLMLSYTGRAYAMAGRKQDALKVLDDLLRLTQQGYAASLGIAFIYYKLGDKEKTFEWLEKACQLRETELLYISVDPFWDDLRQEPRFIALLKKMGLKK